jgi:hypothetical protein
MTRTTNYAQGDPDTGPGTVETVGDVEEEENSAAAESEPGETGNHGDSDAEGADEPSDGASVGSDILGPDGAVTYRTLVNLTGPDWCRVYMTSQGIRAVCGNLGDACTRPRHKAKARNTAHRGPPGWYVGLLHVRRGSAPSLRRDGRLDGPCFSTTEAQDLREQEEAAETAALADTAGPEDRRADETTVRFVDMAGDEGEPASPHYSQAANQTHRDNDHEDSANLSPLYLGLEQKDGSRTWMECDPNSPPPLLNVLLGTGWAVKVTYSSVPSVRNWVSSTDPPPLFREPIRGQPPEYRDLAALSPPRRALKAPEGPPGPRGRTTQGTQATHTGTPEEPTPPTITGWVGLSGPNQSRAIGHSELEIATLTSFGYQVAHCFTTHGEAITWLGESHPGNGRNTEHTLGTRADSQAPQGREHVTTSGPDTSKDKAELFGVKINTIGKMDTFMLPRNTADRVTAEAMYDCASDILALPGQYRRGDDGEYGEDGSTAALVAMVRGQRDTGLHLTYRSNSNNGLRQIKSKDDLYEAMETVPDAWEDLETSQRSQFINILDRSGYDADYIDLYLQTGMLPRIVRDTYTYYVGLLNTVNSHANGIPDEAWNYSLAGKMLAIHRDRLASIRRQSSNYREMILRNYTYLREAHSNKYYDARLNRELWKSQYGLQGAISAPGTSGGGGGGGGGGATSTTPTCPCCKRKAAHTGGEADCPLKPLNAALRRKAMRDLSSRAAQKLCAHIKRALAADSSADHPTLVDAARVVAQS